MSDSGQMKEAPQAPDLRIEKGKFYRTRDGRRVGPMRRLPKFGFYVWVDAAEKVVVGGDGRESAIIPTCNDLVAEWTDEPAPEAISPAPEPGEIAPAPWRACPQEGVPGHCFVAQVFDATGRNVVQIDPTDDPSVATSIAAKIAEAVNSAYAPGHTDLMVDPETLDEFLVKNPPPAPSLKNPDAFDGQSWEVAVRCGYEPLAEILIEALDQSQAGKGKERHARGETPFVDQPILSIARMTGVGGPAFQAIKKVQEACGMMELGEHDRAVRELLGAIVYTAATVIAVREDEARHP